MKLTSDKLQTQTNICKRYHEHAILPKFLTSTWVISLSLAAVLLQQFAEARYKRCFTCRSRGTLGDCRDPFSLNSSTYDGQTGNMKPSIEATPCASGWCAKTIEDNFADSITATDRYCMTRPPTDGEERCSETIFENHRDRKVFLCMCYGDLCNSATSFKRFEKGKGSFELIMSKTWPLVMALLMSSYLGVMIS